MSRKSLGLLIFAYRKSRGHTQQDVATALDTTQGAVSKLEQGYLKPWLSDGDALAKLTGLSLRKLVDEANAERDTAQLPKREERESTADFAARARKFFRTAEPDYDPTPYCAYGHKSKETCDCGPIARNN